MQSTLVLCLELTVTIIRVTTQHVHMREFWLTVELLHLKHGFTRC